MDADKLLDKYYDHYKDTVAFNKEAEGRRNKNFVILCILEAISFMMIKNPDLISALLNDTIKKELETTIVFSNSILQTLVWILIAYVLVRYVQEVLYVERQYDYLNTLEEKISVLMGKESVFNREGEHYLKDYPIVLNLIDLFYKMFSPLLFFVINIIHIIQEWKCGVNKVSFVADIAICIAIVGITWFYFFHIHPKTTEWCKKYIPGIRRISDLLHKILKNV